MRASREGDRYGALRMYQVVTTKDPAAVQAEVQAASGGDANAWHGGKSIESGRSVSVFTFREGGAARNVNKNW